MASIDSLRMERLLEWRRPTTFDAYIDLLSPRCRDALPVLDLDGRSHGGRPWRFRGRDRVGLRLFPSDPAGELAARCVTAARAWTLEYEQTDSTVTVDYDLPWAYAWAILCDLEQVRSAGLPHLLTLAAKRGDWVADFVSETVNHPSVIAAVNADVTLGKALGVDSVPVYLVRGSVLHGTPTDAAVRETIEELIDLDGEAFERLLRSGL